jgi:hypothetical protein
MNVGTFLNPVAFPEDYEERGIVSSATKMLNDSDAQTPVLGRAIDRFQLVMLPFAAAAAVAMSAMRGDQRFVLSSVAGSRTQWLDSRWWFDDWEFTAEAASLADVQALNQLLALPAAEGLVLDYPDD